MFVVEEMLTSAAWMLVVFPILYGLAHRWSEGEPRGCESPSPHTARDCR
jgi:hypothetical protein